MAETENGGPNSNPQGAAKTIRATYQDLIGNNLARPLKSFWAIIGDHIWSLLLLIIAPAAVFAGMSQLYKVLDPVPPGLRLSAVDGVAAKAELTESLCRSGAFAEERQVWAIAACASILACLAVMLYVAFSMRPFFQRARDYWGVIALTALVSAVSIYFMTDGRRVYELVFPPYYIDTLAALGACGDGHTFYSDFSFFRTFKSYFHVINVVSVAMCLLAAMSLVLTITNVKAGAEEVFLERQGQRFRTLLYLGSIVFVVGVWHMSVWANWPVTAFEEMRARHEAVATAAKAQLETLEARLKDATPKINEAALAALAAKEKALVDDGKATSEELAKIEAQRTALRKPLTDFEPARVAAAKDIGDARAKLEKAAAAKTQWEIRKTAAANAARGFLTYFGVLYSLLLIVLFAPAWAALNRAVRVQAMMGKKPDAGSALAEFTSLLKPIMAFLAPLIVASAKPVLDTFFPK
jgi:hypothetical protein